MRIDCSCRDVVADPVPGATIDVITLESYLLSGADFGPCEESAKGRGKGKGPVDGVEYPTDAEIQKYIEKRTGPGARRKQRARRRGDAIVAIFAVNASMFM